MIVRLFYLRANRWLRHMYGNPQASAADNIRDCEAQYGLAAGSVAAAEHEMTAADAEALARAPGWIGAPPDRPAPGDTDDGSVVSPPIDPGASPPAPRRIDSDRLLAALRARGIDIPRNEVEGQA